VSVTLVDVASIPPLDHEEAMDRADEELGRLMAAVDQLDGDDWVRPTDCAGWDVKAMLGHLLGMLELQADPEDRARQVAAADAQVARAGGLRLDAMTALQVREHAHLSPADVRAALHAAVPRGLAARRALPASVRATPYDPQIPGAHGWTLGYLFDVIHTRDPWLHRIDLARAVGEAPVLTPEHDGRIVADVVAEWAGTHGQPVTLELTGPAGGSYVAADGSPPESGALRMDAVDFCRTLSGRATGAGLLTTRVVF
jgi:uncharacterized protein (TIGR03083 family)